MPRLNRLHEARELIANRDHLWRILLVDDNPLDRAEAKAALLSGSLRRYQFEQATSVTQAVALCASVPLFDCVLLDYELADGNALDVLSAIARDANQLPLLPVVIITGDSSGETSRAALRAGAQDYLGKAWLGAQSLTRAVENAVERHAMSREINAQRARQQLIADCARAGVGAVELAVVGGVAAGTADATAAPNEGAMLPLALFKRIGPLVGAELQIHHAIAPGDLTQALHLQASVGLDNTALAQLACAEAEVSLCALAVRARRPIYRSAVQSSDDALVRGLRLIGVRTSVCFPVQVDGQVAGTMSFASRLRDQFTHDELDFMERMVTQVALLQERLRVQVQLRKSEAFNRSLFDASVDCVMVLDPVGRIQHISKNGRLLLELDASQSLQDTSWPHWWPSTVRPRAEAALRDAASGNACTFEGQGNTARGHLKWWEVSISPIHDHAAFEVSRLLVISRDITARRADALALQASRERLRASERELRTLTDNAPDVMTRFDRQLRHVFVNAAITRATGLRPDQVVGKTNRELGMPTSTCDQWDRALLEVFDTGLTQEVAFSFKTPTGTRHYQCRLIAEQAQNLAISHVLGVTHDITEQRELEIQREQLLEAERSARMESDRLAMIKDEFLATLSHELRTPLAAIVGWAGVLQRSLGDAAVVKRGIDAIARNGAAQARLIGDLLDMNRIVSGKLKLDLELIDAAVISTLAVDTLRPTAEAKGVNLALNLADDRAKYLLGDALRLQQVISNLLNNAVKFTPPGGMVTLTVQALRGGAIQFCVSDTGKGMAASFLPFLFDRFSQADGSVSRVNGGLGLGLSIVKQLVDLHSGSVVGHSDGEGQGASFTVTLPGAQPSNQRFFALALQACQAQPIDMLTKGVPATRQPAAMRLPDGPHLAINPTDSEPRNEPRNELMGLTILLVDDQEDVLELCRRLLVERGALVHTAVSADMALRRVQEHTPDLLISDIGMPEMDGYQLMRRIRGELKLSPQHLPAVALSAFTRPVDHARALQAGFGACVDKPVVPNLLLRAVLDVIASARVATAHSADREGAPAPTANPADAS
jgi:PAS domain S-box-containing protein